MWEPLLSWLVEGRLSCRLVTNRAGNKLQVIRRYLCAWEYLGFYSRTRKGTVDGNTEDYLDEAQDDVNQVPHLRPFPAEESLNLWRIAFVSRAATGWANSRTLAVFAIGRVRIQVHVLTGTMADGAFPLSEETLAVAFSTKSIRPHDNN